MSTEEIPEGMVEVSKERFFALLYADKRDIMPTVQDSPVFTNWRVVATREVWGWTKPGWKNPGDPAAYAVKREIT